MEDDMEDEEDTTLFGSDVRTNGPVYILSQPLQGTVIVLIILASLLTNCSVIINIINSDIKKSIVTFVIIKNLCIVDLFGACLVLPAPLVATIKGQWDFGDSLCKLNSIINIGIWVEHIILFAILKVDKIFASVLPIGKYPLLSVSAMTVIVRLSWLVSLLVSLSVNAAFPSSYEPAAVLCIPLLPSGFFFTLLTFLSLIFVSLIVGFSGTFLFLRKKQAEIQNAGTTVSRVDYKALEKNAITTFLVTMSHILLYVPTMLVVGLHGWILPPGAILFCDVFVYSEFLIHPLLLLGASKRMRREIIKGCKARILHLIRTFEEILFLSRKRILGGKSKKIPESSCQDQAQTTHISPDHQSGASLSPESVQQPRLTLSTLTDPEENQEDRQEEEEEEEERVPITFSWPSLEVESHANVHVQEETVDAKQVKVGLKTNFHRISSACDSGYSELDIYSTVTTGQENNAMNVVKEMIHCREKDDRQNSCDSSYLDEFKLYFNLDKMLDKTSHEENCFKELDLSFISEEGSDCSCSEYSCSLTSSDQPLTNRQTVISIAQRFSTNTVTSLTRPPPLPVSRGDSSHSLPVSSSPSLSLTKDGLLHGLRRLSLPKVSADVILVEQTAESRETFI